MPGTSRHLLAYFTEPTTGFFMPTLLKPPASHLLVTPGTSLHLLAYFIKTTGFHCLTTTCLLFDWYFSEHVLA